MSAIHPTAVIDPSASLGKDVEVGPFCYVGPGVVLKEGVRLLSHVVITGLTTVGEQCIVYPFASLGHAPQDLKYKGEASTVEIGSHTTIREYVTIQPGTTGGGMITRVGSHCLLMAGVHVAHDCILGDYVKMANNATLGGHVVIGDYAFIGGLAAVHQFVRIGEYAMIGGTAGVSEDVIPYGLIVPGRKAHLEGLNIVGLKRRGFTSKDIQALRDVYRHLFEESSSVFQERITQLPQELFSNPAVGLLLAFIEKLEGSRRLCFPLRACS